MKGFFCAFLFCLGLVSANLASAKTLVISDIDDTLKNVHVRNSKSLILTAYQTHRFFKGMPELFQSLQRNIPDIEFVYLTNALEYLMSYSHRSFLKRSGFPQGTLYLRGSRKDKDFKLQKLREILQKQKPDQVIFFGDNAERDIYFYAEVLKEYPIPQVTYIRTLYDQKDFSDHIILPLAPGQTGFITPLEILFDFYKRGWISHDDWSATSQVIAQQIVSENLHQDVGSEYFPSWARCTSGEPIQELLNQTDYTLQSAAKKIKMACHP